MPIPLNERNNERDCRREEMFVNERAPKPVLPTWGQTLGSQTLMARQRDALSSTGTRSRELAARDPALGAIPHCFCSSLALENLLVEK